MLRDESLRVPRGKTGPRTVILQPEAVEFFSRVVRSRSRDEPLLPRPKWSALESQRPTTADAAGDRAGWARSGRNVPCPRHSYISRTIEAGVPLTVLAENCGTSVRMIEQTYAKVSAHKRREFTFGGEEGKAERRRGSPVSGAAIRPRSGAVPITHRHVQTRPYDAQKFSGKHAPGRCPRARISASWSKVYLRTDRPGEVIKARCQYLAYKAGRIRDRRRIREALRLHACCIQRPLGSPHPASLRRRIRPERVRRHIRGSEGACISVQPRHVWTVL